MTDRNRRLFIIRHGAASASSNDQDRRLTAEGQVTIAALAAQLVAKKVKFDCVLTSNATRAKQTLDTIVSVLGPISCQQESRKFYQAVAQTWLDALQLLPDSAIDVLVVGHNPALSDLATMLAGSTTRLAPGDMCVLECAQPWHVLDADTMCKQDW